MSEQDGEEEKSIQGVVRSKTDDDDRHLSAPECKKARLEVVGEKSDSSSNDINNNKNNHKPQGQQAYKRQRVNPEVLQTRRNIQLCCKSNDLQKAWKLYEEATCDIEPQTYFCLLGLCDGFGNRGLHIGTPRHHQVNNKGEQASAVEESMEETKNGNSDQKQKQQRQRQRESCDVVVKDDSEVSIEQRRKYAFQLKDELSKAQIKMNETAYTALIRVLCKGNTLEGTLEAEKVLQEALDNAKNRQAKTAKPKLRLFSALIHSWSQQGTMKKVVRVWQQVLTLMSEENQTQLKLSEKEYCDIIQCATKVGDANVFSRVLRELAEDVLVPSHDTIRAIEEWFSSQGATANPPSSDVLAECELMDTEAPSMGPVIAPSIDNEEKGKVPSWIISQGCQIETATGTLLDGCLSGQTLHPIKLSPKDRCKMLEMNDIIVKQGGLPEDTSAYAGGGKGRKKKADSPQRRLQHWKCFTDFLEEQTGPPRDMSFNEDVDNSEMENQDKNNKNTTEKRPFDVILDAANIGYFKQNYGNAPKHVDYKQIDWVVKRFAEDKKKRVLIILHERHFHPNLMPSWARPITDQWDSPSVSLYKAPAGCNDDWFWLHAALWCGKHCMAVTNDEMRDHHFQMLSHRSFLRWKERHQIHFAFGEWETVEDKKRDDNDRSQNNVPQDKRRQRRQNRRQVILQEPDVYSRRIQRLPGENLGLVIPLPKRGDENRFLDGDFVSTEDPTEETYVCIALK